MSDIVVFHGVEFDPIELNGEKAVRVSAVARALGYAVPDKLGQLIRRNPDEFNGKAFSLNLSENPKGGRPETVLTYHGVIRAAMLSNAPRAKEFRDWAEDVLFKVMTTGHYEDPRIPQPHFNHEALTQVLNQMNETLLIQGKMVQNLASELNEMREWRSHIFIPAQPDNSYWPTPTQRIKVLVPKHKIPKHFNIAGTFDGFASMRHANIRGGLLTQRDRRMIGKMPEYVIQPCPENDQFLREAFHEHLQRGSIGQQRLKLIPMKTQPERTIEG